uniref:Uncharacterized protein n=1 Tax=Podoviridae sp. ctrTt13 TaxID=2825279 RepID=A0A8S5NSF0_9CAUD|nr:MAG TPA: hypothetical protein [Podoviridae sp. ctrTt13]
MKSVPTVQSEIWEKQRWINNLQLRTSQVKRLRILRQK